MKKLPCPRCGDTNVVGTFCARCQRELHPIIANVKEPSVTFCIRSGKIKLKNAWEALSPEEAVQKAVEHALKPAPESSISKITCDIPDFSEMLENPGIDKIIEVPVIITGRSTNDSIAEYDEEYVIPVNIKTTISKAFAKMGTQYFEGTLQIRNETEERRAVLEKITLRHAKGGFAFNKEVKQKNGTDYFGTNNQIMQQIATELQQRFGGLMKYNRKLHGRDRQRSRDVYRVTVFLEYPPFEKDDVLIDEKDVWKVLNLGKKIRFQNLSTGKKKEFLYEADRFEKLPQYKTTVSQVEPTLAVIDPETFQQIRIWNQNPPEVKPGDEVLVVKKDGKVWIVE